MNSYILKEKKSSVRSEPWPFSIVHTLPHKQQLTRLYCFLQYLYYLYYMILMSEKMMSQLITDEFIYISV